MASSRRLKKLDCFYCGVKSDVLQNGNKQHFDCKHCLSTNYVDQYGDVMDPPSDVFSLEASPPPIHRYAQQVAEPIYDSSSSQQHVDQPFCETCQKNQHMYQSFISNYDPDTNIRHDTRSLSPDKQFLAYKTDMQQRYPQVCADCKRGVEERIRKANRMAQADVLRHKLDKTKTKRSMGRDRSWLELLSLWGGFVYWAATVGQSLVCLLGLAHAVLPRLSRICTPGILGTDESTDTRYPLYLATMISISACSVQKLLITLESATSQLPSLGVLSILMTLASFWWNPYFRNMIRGFDRHIHGFLDWYKYQAILLVTRVVFWTMMGEGQFSRKDAPATMGAYCFMLAFTIMIARISRQSIQVDLRKLFTNGRESKLEDSPMSTPAQTSVYRGNSLLEALNDTTNNQAITKSPNGVNLRPKHLPLQNKSPNLQRLSVPSSPIAMPRAQLSLAEMSEQEAVDHLRGNSMSDYPQDELDDNRMDWTPSGGSRYPDFKPLMQIPLRASPPVVPKDPQPFWYKVPPAPKNQTHKPFDPFKKPLFEPASAEKKENFFNSMTGRTSRFDQAAPVEEKREMHMAPPKFFAQKAFESTGLEDLMEKAFTIKVGDTPGKPKSKGMFERASTPDSPTLSHPTIVLREVLPSTMAQGQSGDWLTHLIYTLGLSIAFALWHNTFTNTHNNSKQTAIGIMTLLVARSIRILTDNTMTEWAKKNAGLRTAMATTLGGLEAAFAAYLGLEILGGERMGEQVRSKGAGLIGVMLVQEVWFLFF